MSGASARFSNWTENKVLMTTADAGFKVENILVEGRNFTDVDALKAIVNVEKGDPIFSFHPNAAKKMIGKLSWVKSVKVERRLPDTIYVGLQERTPMALWQRHKRLSLIDSEGVILADHNLEKFKDFIILVGGDVPKQAPTFLRLLQSEPLLFERVRSASLISDRRWDLKLRGDVVVKLPEKDIALALRRLVVIHEKENLLNKDIKVIDVREPTRVTVRTKPGAVQEYKTGFQKTGHVGGAI